ncbi:protein PHOTOPERIOD-INDEPENDENT EARLY FLOWERING 1-like isoform X3 [Coffea arabica]|uniref:Protein PHOTOPERIOD-INDEPENDENT EARLY FLOWERING 1-like isoform X3 n=1 Tax=Coffea arabica TaxID=13443 RepID=A0ABM4UW24_COFAR
MASKGPRSKLDHETRARRQKALEAPKEPRRPKTHWDHVLEEMVWLSKDFESERKWKLAQAKKVAIRASKGMLEQATRGEKRVKEEEHRLKKVALNISKDVKKFWLKIEKLVLYKHQLELDEKKKKALDKQLEFLLGQTERYSTMLAENLVSSPGHCKLDSSSPQERMRIEYKEGDYDRGSAEPNIDIDGDYDMDSEDESEDDEHTIEQDEALITKEEREEELAALQDEIDLPLEELLKRYEERVSRKASPEQTAVATGANGPVENDNTGKENEIGTVSANGRSSSPVSPGRRCVGSNGFLHNSNNHFLDVQVHRVRTPNKFQDWEKQCILDDYSDEQDDEDFDIGTGEEKDDFMDDETTLLEEEELAKAEPNDAPNEIALLQKESEIPIEDLLARYKKDWDSEKDEHDDTGSEYASASENFMDSPEPKDRELKELKVSLNREDNFSAFQPAACSEVEEPETEYVAKAGEEGESADIIADAAAAARSAQPTGNTFSTTKVRTKFPFLLKYPLREYQHIGLDWLVTMYEKKLNGILADEMGLGKTIMTIALLAHLACEKGIWGPHLIVVPTSVMLNWETEFLKWCPAFKILTYFGSAKERRIKRQGWLKPNSFHVCITTYRLVIQDAKVFKRKKWKYLILDEAHLIKNWKSQRWQTLLNFNSKRRILLTGTPLQNDLMELWSLMHFLMPHIFQSHQEFKDWFSNPISGMVEGQEKVNKEVVDRLHNVLRPFILRRLKRDVEKQLPMKYEHVIYCRLSKRQRNLYEDFIASSETQATLASSNFFGMISVIMQLRKVCNHPDLFEGRPIVSSFDMTGIDLQLSSSVCAMLTPRPFSTVDLGDLGLSFTHLDNCMSSWESEDIQAIATPSSLIEGRVNQVCGEVGHAYKHKKFHGMNIFEEIQKALTKERQREAKERAASIAWWNSLRCRRKPIYSTGLQELVTIKNPVYAIHDQKSNPLSYSYSSKLADIVLSPVERFHKMVDQVESFMFAIPAARAPTPDCWCSKGGSSVFIQPTFKERCSEVLSPLLTPLRPAVVRRQVYFPDRRLIQFDCGKLQELALLLRRLKLEGHRALIFTQMTKMLDVLEAFINLYGYTYMRLDGSTQPEERQTLMQRFNTNPKIFLFILSTRSGGVGINLVGADTVIFYDSDWNPAMDQQAQDRCHRIGQTREVHIYRLISESTIEENILKKANQKRVLDDLVIQSGGYNTEFFKKLDPMELFTGHQKISVENEQKEDNCNESSEVPLSNADVEAALKYAEDEADYMALKKVEQEEAVENQEFTEEAIGRLEEEEFGNEEDLKTDEPAEHDGQVTASNKDSVAALNVEGPVEGGSITFAGKEDDFDMLADVKEMAAAAAASGQTILSFENQLRPIDRYAIRFMELWDPIIDKTATQSQVQFEEKEWELDRIEKLKEDMEADIEDDEEPFVYESWDADFATEVYRQQVEALTQHQLMEELEAEAKEKELAEYGYSDSVRNQISTVRKPKSKKKTKKAKFKSLKKGALASEFKAVKEESAMELMSIDGESLYDDEMTSSGDVSPCRRLEKKRKQAPWVDEERSTKKSKKFKKAPEMCSSVLDSNMLGKLQNDTKYSRQCESRVVDVELKSVSRSKIGKKVSIIPMPVKRVMTIRPEKLKKKGNMWPKDCFPVPDFWSPQEDAILCAAVHEYGANWSLVSEMLYGMSTGGLYRGRYRYPVHCCERFRELIQRYVLTSTDPVNNDKASNTGSGKGLLKVTEDHTRMLLDVASQFSDAEPLIQKHFFALLSSVWRFSSLKTNRHNLAPSQNASSSYRKAVTSPLNVVSRDFSGESLESMKFTNSFASGKLVAAALCDDHTAKKDDNVPISKQRDEASVVSERLDVTLQLLGGEHDTTLNLPSVVNLSILGRETPPSSKTIGQENHLKPFQDLAENRFRAASRACLEDSFGWATLAFPVGDAKSRTPMKVQSLGKHKLLVSDSNKSSRSKLRKTTTESSDARSFAADPVLHPVLSDFCVKDDVVSTSSAEIGMADLCVSSPFNINPELPMATDSSDMVAHDYVPGFISGLDDYLILPEFTDIG